ncbi:hypothetical protein NQ317_012224 [Molorchus minor]|uniref:GIY-YIG domain-containing protein n=1 Tax=Molorchus minor TaxID=1323400 RepID=A0ABQ9JFI0_9CUCU|nr:hypothetical protein NQ317_012224 [Molorchus minor]
MDDLIEDSLPKLDFQIPFLKKYVDDMILSIPQGGTEQLLQVFNNYDTYLQFTIENEDEQHSVPFLDTKLIRKEDNTIITSWYTKPGASGRFLHYESYHHQRHKINLVLGMKNRIVRTSHPTLCTQNMHTLFERFKKSGYPPKLLNSLLFNRSHINDNDNPPGITTPLKYFSVPYLDKDNIFNSSNMIYCMTCLDCDKKYIGQTCRKLKDRITAHKSDIRNNKQSCTLARHVVDHNHSIDYENVKILDTENNLHKRLFLEMAHIFKEDNTMNARTDIESLSILYTYLLSLDKDNNTHDRSLGVTI